MDLVQKWPFFQLFFQAIQARKMCFMIFYNQKTPFQAKKKQRGRKSKKKCHFSKGVNPRFSPKMAIFPTFFFKAIQARKMSFIKFQNKKTHFKAIKTRSSKNREIDIFPKGLTHGFSPKMPIFPTFFFLAHIGHEKVFYVILERKHTFLGYKNKKFKKTKN